MNGIPGSVGGGATGDVPMRAIDKDGVFWLWSDQIGWHTPNMAGGHMPNMAGDVAGDVEAEGHLRQAVRHMPNMAGGPRRSASDAALAAESRRRHIWRATKAAPLMLSTTGATREPITPRSMRTRVHDQRPRACLPRQRHSFGRGGIQQP